MQLREALAQIAEIRQQVARTQFRGYRSATTAFSALVAVAAAALHRHWIGDATFDQMRDGLWIWLAAATLSLAVVGVEMARRYRRSDSELHRQTTLLAAEQFVPCLVAGVLLTYGIEFYAGTAMDLLPGIWCALFGLGVLSSRRLLPRGAFSVGAWYLLASLACIAMRRQVGFATQMAVAFGVGQTLAAGVLYWMLERPNRFQPEIGRIS